jgi:hypothetical protein
VHTQELIARHRDHLTSLSVEGEPLSETSAHATIRNPAWFRQVTKEPTTARRRLHEQILARAEDRASHVSCDRQAIVLAGPPGAGKTGVLSQVLAARRGAQAEVGNWRTLNSDDFKDDLLEQAIADGSYEAFVKPLAVRDLEAGGERFYPRELSALVHEESSMLVRAVGVGPVVHLWAGPALAKRGAVHRGARGTGLVEDLDQTGDGTRNAREYREHAKELDVPVGPAFGWALQNLAGFHESVRVEVLAL